VRPYFTKNKFRKSNQIWSKRLFFAKEAALDPERWKKPVLIINLDGAMGYWDDLKSNFYVLRPKVLDGLLQLSYDFRLVAVSIQKKKRILPLIYGLMNLPVPSENSSSSKAPPLKHLVFDGVY